MRVKITGLAMVLLAVVSLAIQAQTVFYTGCVEGRHHYEGHPKPNVYVVTVRSMCDEGKIVTVKIVDAIYGAEVRSEQFPLDPGESRAVRIEYQGDKYFSYGISHTPAD